MHRKTGITAVAIALAVALVGLAGCARAETPSPVEAPVPSATIEPMGLEQKQTLIATSFPVEVPVPAGTVRRGQAQGTDAWDYEIEIDAPIVDVEQWYQQAYSGRNWQQVERVQGEGMVSLTFVKAAAQSRVDLAERDGSTTALVVLGVGAPVLQTQ